MARLRQPGEDRHTHVPPDVLLVFPDGPGHVEGMVTALDDLQGNGRGYQRKLGFEHLQVAQDIPCPLYEQHRAGQLGPMPDPQLIDSLRRMQRIAEKNQALTRLALRRHLRSHAAAQVLARQIKLLRRKVRIRMRRTNHDPPSAFQQRNPVRRLAAQFLIGEVELHAESAGFGQDPMGMTQEGMLYIISGAMGQKDGAANCAPILIGDRPDRRDFELGINLDFAFFLQHELDSKLDTGVTQGVGVVPAAWLQAVTTPRTMQQPLFP
jgi:hypothetical protein